MRKRSPEAEQIVAQCKELNEERAKQRNTATSLAFGICLIISFYLNYDFQTFKGIGYFLLYCLKSIAMAFIIIVLGSGLFTGFRS